MAWPATKEMEGDETGRAVEEAGPFCHGTKADLSAGEVLKPDDPHLTDKEFPGNPTKSYRSRHPLRVIGEVVGWEPHPPEVLQALRERLEELERLGVEAIND